MSQLRSDSLKTAPKIAIATGTRADWGLLLPLAKELRSRGVEPRILATGSHFFEELGSTASEIAADGFPDFTAIPIPRETADATAESLRKFAKELIENPVDALIVLGDRFEMLGVASAALFTSTPLVHIAGGNVTLGAFDNSIRNAISMMATLHLAETEGCAERLRSMNVGGKVVRAGSPGVWNALNTPLMTLSELEENLGFRLGEDFLLATLHTATLDNVSPLKRMEDFLDAMETHLNLNPERRLILTYPNSDVDPAPLIALIEKFASRFPDRVKTIPSLGRIRYLSAASLCKAVVGNSSSGIEETPSLGVPTLDIGDRQKGRERGNAVVHCEADRDSILKGLQEVCSTEAAERAAERINPYYTADTPGIMANEIIAMVVKTKRRQ